jgi:hypothetical protein
MANEKSETKVFELLSQAEKGTDITIRDDQNDFSTFLDSAKLCRQKGGRFRLIDTGKLSLFELEWLAQGGADIYTSDEARSNKREIELLAKACSKGKAIVAYFHHGPLQKDKEGDSTSLSFLLDIGRSGAYLHLSNRDRKRGLADLTELAYACRKAESWLVYYHHSRPVDGLKELARAGGWIHISDQSLESAEDTALLMKVIKESIAAETNLVLHIEEGLELDVLRDIIRAGAFVIFKTPLSDYKSSFRALEQQAQRRKLDFKAYYLYTTILP